jgi:sortase A
MRPDDPQMKHPSLLVPQRPHAPSIDTRTVQPAQQQATADMARTQLDSIYMSDPHSLMTAETETVPKQPEQAPAPAVDNSNRPAPQPPESNHQVILDRKQQYAPTQPVDVSKTGQQSHGTYERTHSEANLHAADDRWKQYHSAWQNYYQEYYRRYYGATHSFGGDSPSSEQQSKTPEEAIDDLRGKLKSNIKAKTTKVRKSRHFVPLMAAAVVMLLFMSLQYNRLIVANVTAYVSPGSIEPENIIIDPNMSMEVGQEPRLIIPKINVDVPVVYSGTMGATQEQTHERQMAAMEKGVAWFGIPGANSKPGQNGNTVLSGHSSNDWLDNGEYKFIFARLERMQINDTLYLNYKGTRYAYNVYDKKVVLPTELDALRVSNDKPILTLITCTPLGTSEKRLLIYAEQISPSPSNAEAAPDAEAQPQPVQIPGVRQSFLGGLFD